MDPKYNFFIFPLIAIICLALAVWGIVNNIQIQYTDNPLNSAQSMSILALALLSVGLFYRNHASKIEMMRGHVFLKWLGIACLFFFTCLSLIILWISQFKITIPIYVALLAIGLFFGNKVMNSEINPKELELSKKIAQFYHSPMGNYFYL